ncbi:Protein translation factor SUI1-like protein [Morus notabilis]|uniref:Protein translation factor SUI1-like protein n=1 Tax=Morus notabilis TaxID=981085 RepID=W9QXV3_9ROSA|nr:protein translation factor SUI1 homolog [Morus notabilis]EXB50313.1 Protein translation factor SUI1-like protein [Morus notabilis]
MVDQDYEIPSSFDPFADPEVADSVPFSGRGKEYCIHIRVQQRNGKKCLTTVQGCNKDLDLDKVLKSLKKEFCCNGNVVQDKVLGKIIQLQGDQRKNVSKYLVKADIVKKEHIKIHGF